jgi:uncharacterized membrane protein
VKYRMGAALLSLVGVFVALYLYLFKIGKIGSLVCGTGGCETVQLSRYSRFLGVEVSLIGLIGYLGLLAFTLWSLRPGLAGARWPATLLVLLSGVGVVFAVYLTWLELFVIHAICRWCVGSAAIITAIFIAALLDRRHASTVTA